MNVEEMQEKIRQIKSKIGRIAEQDLLKEFNKIYEDARGEEILGESLNEVMQGLTRTSKNSERRGLSGFLTPEQITELEERTDRITKALDEARELRDNSEIDRIDDYVKTKIEDNETEMKGYKDENTVLEGQKKRLEGTYKDYQSNNKAAIVAQKVEKLVGYIIDGLSTVNDANASQLDKDNAKKQMKAHGKEVAELLQDDAVKKPLIKYNSYFHSDPSEWKQPELTEMKNKTRTLAGQFTHKRDDSKDLFNQRIKEVPPQYVNTPVEAFLQDVDQKYNKIEDKWAAIGGKVNENTKKIKELNGQNKAYKQYARDVKETQDIEEKRQFSDEELDEYLSREQNSERLINSDTEVVQLATNKANIERRLAVINAQTPKDMDIEDVLNWKRTEYLANHDKKANKYLKRINKKIQKENKLIRRLGGEEKEEATLADLIHNTEKVKDIKYRGRFRNEHRYSLRSRIPILGKRRYCKQFYNKQLETYNAWNERIGQDYANKRREVKDNIRERYRSEQEIKLSMKDISQKSFMKDMYRNHVEETER